MPTRSVKKPSHIFGLAVALLLCAALGRHAHGQQARGLDPARALTQYLHQVWTTDEGLPQNSVNAIAQTRDGYLWLGTEEGLVRFDGARFTILDKSNTAAFASAQAIHALFEDRDGTLWVGTVAGLVRLAGGRLSRYDDERLREEPVSTLYEDRQGTLWVGTNDGLFALADGRLARYSTDDGLASNQVNALFQDRSGALWIGTGEGLHRFADGAFTVYHQADGPSENLITAIEEDRDGRLWLGTRGGLYFLQGDALHPYAPGDTDAVWALWADPQGSLWIGMDRGLRRLRAGRLDVFAEREGLSEDRVISLYHDEEGSLWIGTLGRGLQRLWDGKFTAYTTAEGLSHDMVTTVYEDAGGALWIGTDGGGLNRLQDGTFTTYTTAEGLSSDIVTSVYEDGQGALWIGTLGGGLNRLYRGRFTAYTTAQGLPSNRIYGLYEDSRGALWIATTAGLVRYRNGAFKTYTTDDGLSSNEITTFTEDAEGALWIGTYEGGLNRLLLSDHDAPHFTHLSTDDGLGSNMVLALHADAEGALWIGTYEGGLARLEKGTLTTYSTKEGLFSDKIYAILEDDEGSFWMSCNKGLFQVSKQTLNAFAAGRIDHVATVAYGKASTAIDKADRLRSFEINGGSQPAAWKRRDGTLWFPTVEGVVSINPRDVRWNRRLPPVLVEEIRVDGKPFDPASAEKLYPGKKKFEFQYTALSFIAPENIRFRYLLEGYDTDWQPAGPARLATYTNLDPGTYTFRVKARNSDGFWNEAGAAVTFEIKPFFYQTPWFYALSALAMLLMAVAAYRLRVGHLKRRERELQGLVETRTQDLRTAKEKIEAQAEKLLELDRFKTRFFANVSHEFRTPLTMIVGPLENALQGSYGALDAPLHRQIDIMLRNAMRLMRLINQLLDLSKLEAGKMQLQARPRNLVPFLEGVVLSCTAFAEQKGIALRFHSDQEDLPLYFEPDKLEKVFFNLLSNATKFTPRGGAIDVSVTRRPPTEAMPEGAAEIRVRDTGKGIAAEDLPYIFDRFHQVDNSNTREHEGTGIGLALVKELVLLHHGTIDVESEVDRGTTFTVVLPTGKAHLNQANLAGDGAPDEGFEPEQSAMAELAFSALGFMPENEPLASNGHAPGPAADEPLVLVVEDNADVREYVASILGAHYRIATARDGQEGLERARELQPDLLISDVMMPRMDGNELCRAIKQDAHLDHIPVVLLTARATQEMKIEGLEVGADDYLAKPFNARELLARAHNLIQLRRQERELKFLNDDLEQQVARQVKTILEERQRYEQQLIQAKEQAETSLRLKSAILDNLNHEFRTPLTAIQGYAQILSKEVRTDLQEFTGHIGESGERLMKTLDAVHQLSRLEAENYHLDVAPLNVVEAAGAARRRFGQAAARKGLALRVETPDGEAIWARLDASALERILDYLLDNALKFTEAGEVVVAVRRHEDQVALSVRDTGIGIDAAFLPHLFEAFTQESTGLTRTHGGIGLGLTVARRLAALIGGSITVESTKGKGSVFTAHFPVADPPASDAPPTRLLHQPHTT